MAENNVTVVKRDNNVTVVEQNNQVSIASKGVQGAKGDTGAAGAPGPQGPAGISAGSFVFEQQTNSNLWTIVHHLGYRPAVYSVDYFKNTIEGDVEHIDTNSLTISFIQSVSGYAYLS